jgi:hypothetical protein
LLWEGTKPEDVQTLLSCTHGVRPCCLVTGTDTSFDFCCCHPIPADPPNFTVCMCCGFVFFPGLWPPRDPLSFLLSFTRV